MFKKPTNLTESLSPLFCMYALIGHGIFRYPAQKQRPVFSAFYAVAMTILYLVALGFTLKFVFEQPWYGDDERVVFLVIYVNVGISVFGAILSWCNAKRFARIIQDLTLVDETLQALGATFDYARARFEAYLLILSWIVMVTLFNWVDTLWFHDTTSVDQIFMIATVLHHPVHINSIVAFNFSVSVSLLRTRYKKANTILEGLKEPIRPKKISAWQMLRHKSTIAPTLSILSSQTGQLSTTTRNHKCLIQIIKHVHLKLGKVAKGLNEAYGMQMALEIAALFVMFTGLLYELYVLAFKPMECGRILRIVVIGIWIAVYFVKLMLINETCEMVCTEAQRTGEIIHCMDENTNDPDTRNEISQFSLQLLHDPLEFSPAGLITLGHGFVKRFLSTVTTYLVILIQMTPSKPDDTRLS